MFAGHLGVALAAGRIEPRVNVGTLAAASLLLDVLLWGFILAGWESVRIPAGFPRTHQPEFVFPYSHGLAAALAWSALAGAILLLVSRSQPRGKSRSAFLVAGVVFSHWLLDALVHRPELPLTGAASRQVGIGLWNNMPVALTTEAALVLAGAVMFFPRCGLPRRRALAVAALSLLVLAFTVVGGTVAPPPPSGAAMAGSSLGAVALVSLLFGWLGRGAPDRQA